MLKQKTYISLIFILIFYAFLWSFQNQNSSRAKLFVKKDKHHFGDVVQGKTVAYDFSFQNTGKDTLVIEHVEGSCSCTAALASKSKIAPGDSGSISVKLNTKGRIGLVKRTVDIFSNDSTSWNKTLYIQANVVKK